MQITQSQTEHTPTPLQVNGVLSTQVLEVWDEVEPLVQKALEYSGGKYHSDDILNGIANQDMQLWVAYDDRIKTIMVTEILNYPRKKVCGILIVAGERIDDLLWVDEITTKWAQEQGCDAIEFYGRAGWERKLKNYYKVHTVMRKDL